MEMKVSTAPPLPNQADLDPSQRTAVIISGGKPKGGGEEEDDNDMALWEEDDVWKEWHYYSYGVPWDTTSPPFTKAKDKFFFALGVVNCLFTAWAVGGHQWVIPLYYTVKFPVFIVYRLCDYYRHKWHYFLLDFCYFGTMLTRKETIVMCACAKLSSSVCVRAKLS
jgi:hypothetical protein